MSRTRVFAFLDIEEAPVAWAGMRGVLASSKYMYDTPQKGFISFMLAGMLKYQNNIRYYNEAIIEKVRLDEFPNQVSRLTGMFFFPSKEDAIARVGDKKWPPYFNNDNLVELDFHFLTQLTTVDSNWITYAPLNNNGFISNSDIQWIKKYWSGKPFNNNPVWEVIGEGVAIIKDVKIRQKCHNIVTYYFPEAEISILLSRIASEVGSNTGSINPVLMSTDDGIKLEYLIDHSGYHDSDLLLKIQDHPATPTLAKLMSEKIWKLPDFSFWSANIALKEDQFSDQELKGMTTFHILKKDNSL